MKQNLNDTVALLTRTPAVLDALLRGLPEGWTQANEGRDTWSPHQVVGHLIHAEHTDWVPRARMIVEHGEGKTFEPFVREGQERKGETKTMDQLLDGFAAVRKESLAALAAMKLSSADLERKGRHPSLGVVTLSQLLATWVGHDLTHLHQISRTLAHQYRQAVGPWTAYLGVMQCAGHSES